MPAGDMVIGSSAAHPPGALPPEAPARPEAAASVHVPDINASTQAGEPRPHKCLPLCHLFSMSYPPDSLPHQAHGSHLDTGATKEASQDTHLGTSGHDIFPLP